MEVRGRAWKFGDNIDTDLIIPGQYLTVQDPKELGKHCMEGADRDFASKVRSGDILVPKFRLWKFQGACPFSPEILRSGSGNRLFFREDILQERRKHRPFGSGIRGSLPQDQTPG